MMGKVNKREYSEIKAKKLAEVVSGQLNGNPSRTITGASGIDNSGPREVTFAESNELLKQAEQSSAGLVLISREMNSELKDVIKVDNPRLAYARAASLFAPHPYYN
ncbi:MAG: LpxD N-terminal domain-containing protein, partial [bacterium]